MMRHMKNFNPESVLLLGSWGNSWSNKTGARSKSLAACLKNKLSRSVTKAFTSIFIRTSTKVAISINTCVARRNGANVTANKIAGDASPTASALMNAHLSLTTNPVSATGKAIALSAMVTEAWSPLLWSARLNIRFWPNRKPNRPGWCARALNKDLPSSKPGLYHHLYQWSGVCRTPENGPNAL